MRSTIRVPSFEIVIIRPDYSAMSYREERRVATFVSHSPTSGDVSAALISYSWTESLTEITGGFSLSLTAEPDVSGRTWYDRIQAMDLVFISEFGVQRYMGVVQDRRFTSRMTDNGPSTSIVISGISLGGVLQQLQVMFDMRLWPNQSFVASVNQRLQVALQQQMNENQDVSGVMIQIFEAFLQIFQAVGETSSHYGILGVIRRFVDYSGGISRGIRAQYPIALSLFTVGANTIFQAWQNFLLPPLFEMFGIWTPEQQFRIVYRETPFDASDWIRLRRTNLPTVLIRGCDLGTSTAEAVTFFYATIPGLGISESQSLAIHKDSHRIDQEKWSRFGYRPMSAEFRFFRRGTATEFNAGNVLLRMSTDKLYRWYRHNDEFASGTVSLMADSEHYPRIGERVRLLGGDFYVESANHHWSYMAPMETTLTITRGAVYAESGQFIRPVGNLVQQIKAEGRSR